MRAILIFTTFLVALPLSACTEGLLYESAQLWRRNECNKLPDKAEYDRCVSEASTTYGSYKQQTEASRKQ